jgi:predicted  nucleic acid-binding Zn-ribbon protein
MSANRSADLDGRIASLEQELKELRQRIAALERLMGAGSEHPSDQATVRKKVAYDWQA